MRVLQKSFEFFIFMWCQIIMSKGETDEPSVMSQFMLKWQSQKKKHTSLKIRRMSLMTFYATLSYFIQHVSYCVNSGTAGSAGCGTEQGQTYDVHDKVTWSLTSKLLFVRISRSGRCCNTCAYISLVSKLWINCKVHQIKVKTSAWDWDN